MCRRRTGAGAPISPARLRGMSHECELETHLYPILGQVGFDRQHFAGIDVRIVGLLERLLQLVQLVAGEDRATVAAFLLLLFATEPVDAVHGELFARIYAVACSWGVGAECARRVGLIEFARKDAHAT